MDETPTRPIAPAGWLEALAESEADLAAGRIVPGDEVMRDLTDASDEQVAAERARIGGEGWGARLLALQGADGQWKSGVPAFPSAQAKKWWHSLAPERKGTLKRGFFSVDGAGALSRSA